MHIMADKPHYPEDQVIEALMATGGRIYLTAERLGCHANTVQNYIKRSPQVREALAHARGRRAPRAAGPPGQVDQAGEQGQPWAIVYTLKTLGKDRGYTTRMPDRQEPFR